MLTWLVIVGVDEHVVRLLSLVTHTLVVLVVGSMIMLGAKGGTMTPPGEFRMGKIQTRYCRSPLGWLGMNIWVDSTHFWVDTHDIWRFRILVSIFSASSRRLLEANWETAMTGGTAVSSFDKGGELESVRQLWTTCNSITSGDSGGLW